MSPPHPAAESTEQIPAICFCAVFFFILTTTFSIAMLAVRSPFDSPGLLPILDAFLLAGATIFTWQTAWGATRNRAWSKSQTTIVLSLIVLLLPCLTVHLTLLEYVARLIFAVIIIAGIAIAVRELHGVGIFNFVILLLAPLLGISYFVYANSLVYASFLTPEEALLGSLHRDTLYHASLASMIAYQQGISTGLDGFIWSPYHVMSHFWIGLTGRWMQTTTLHAYYLLPQIVLFPLALFFMTVASLSLRREKIDLNTVAFYVIIPLGLLQVFDIFDRVILFNSESHQLSIVLFLLGLPLLIDLAGRKAGRLAFWFALAFGIAILMAKIAAGTIWFVGLLVCVLLRSGLCRSAIIDGAVIAIAWLSSLYFVLSSVQMSLTQFDLFQYYRNYPIDAWTGTIAVLALCLCAVPLLRRGLDREPTASLFVALGAASLIPTIFFSSAGGTLGYFLDVGVWIAVVFLSSLVRFQSVTQRRFVMAVVVLAMSASWTLFSSKSEAWANFLGRIKSHGGNLEASARGPTSLENMWAGLREVGRLSAESYGASVVRMLSSEVGYGARTLVFAPPSNALFWNTNPDCFKQPFFVPALLAVPMINGIHPNCSRGDYWLEYDVKFSGSRKMTDAKLCEKAAAQGYSKVFVFGSLSERRFLHCKSRDFSP